MIRLDERLLAMLEKTHLFNFQGYSLAEGFVAGARVVPPQNYQFYIPNAFLSSNNREDVYCFKSRLEFFLKTYLFGWADKKIKQEKNFDSLAFAREAVSFFSGFEFKKCYEALVSGKEYFTIKIDANNTLFRCKRFGDILGIGIQSSSDKPHKLGIATLEDFCREEDRGNNHGIYELIDKVDIFFSLSSISKNGQFGPDLHTKLSEVLYFCDLSTFDSSRVVDAFKKSNYRGVSVGKYHGLDILMGVDYKGIDKTDVRHTGHYDSEARAVFREASVRESQNGFCFLKPEEIIVTITLKSSLPNFTRDMGISFDAHDEQFLLAKAGSIFSSQLCSMVVSEWIEHRRRLEKK